MASPLDLLPNDLSLVVSEIDLCSVNIQGKVGEFFFILRSGNPVKLIQQYMWY